MENERKEAEGRSRKEKQKGETEGRSSRKKLLSWGCPVKGKCKYMRMDSLEACTPPHGPIQLALGVRLASHYPIQVEKLEGPADGQVTQLGV